MAILGIMCGSYSFLNIHDKSEKMLKDVNIEKYLVLYIFFAQGSSHYSLVPTLSWVS